MASYHLDVKSVQRSAGRSATAAAAYRHAERIECQREGRVHDYTRKQGVEVSFILAPDGAPAWAQDRAALWNAAEARDTRVNSVTAREWEVALPHELDGAGRRALAEGFARELVARYGVAADVAIHAPHREGDQRNWHAHVMTTTRVLTQEGLTDKTRVLDAKQTRGTEVTHMRERWAVLQNDALEQHGHEERVDHRSLAAQRETALARGDEQTADNLDRAPEVKLGPVVSGIERREQRAAEREERTYEPLTERGAQVHEARQARSLLAELTRLREALREQVRERAELARQTYAHAREDGADRISAGLAALRAAAQRQGIATGQGIRAGPEHGQARGLAHEREHGLTQGREARQTAGDERHRDPVQERDARAAREASRESIKEQLRQIRAREVPHHAQDTPEAGLSAAPSNYGPDRQHHEHRERSLSTAAIRERLEALRDRLRPAAQREEPTAGLPAQERGPHRAEEAHRAHSTAAIREQLAALRDRARPAVQQEREEPARALPALGQDQERSQEATHGLQGLDAARERLRAALDQARPIAQERTGPGYEGQAHGARAHEDEGDEHTHTQKERGHDHGWGL